jgi:hypothetical protein
MKRIQDLFNAKEVDSATVLALQEPMLGQRKESTIRYLKKFYYAVHGQDKARWELLYFWSPNT